METNTHDITIKFRLDSPTSELLDRARSYTKLDKSKFIRQSVREKAEAVIAEHEKTQFSQEDWRMFFDLLDTPSKPTGRMVKAAQKYSEIIQNNAI